MRRGNAAHETESKELDVETVLEALQALNDGIAIYGPDDRQLFVNEVAYNRFRTYYQGMADGLTHMEALRAANSARPCPTQPKPRSTPPRTITSSTSRTARPT